MRKYINITRLKGDKFLCGHANFPYGTTFYVDAVHGYLYTIKDHTIYPICLETSETAYRSFAYNDDGNAEERHKLITECVDIMASMHDKDEKFIVLFHDSVAMKYKKHPENTNEWSWNRLKVHTAPIEDLKYLRDLFLRLRNTEYDNLIAVFNLRETVR